MTGAKWNSRLPAKGENKMEIIEKARELADLLREDKRCLRLQAAKAANDLDTELQSLIGEFNLKKIALQNELDKTAIDRDKARGFEKEMREVYAKIMAKPSMKEYEEAKREVDTLVGHINSIVQAGVSGEPEATDPAGCSGNCAGCPGCH